MFEFTKKFFEDLRNLEKSLSKSFSPEASKSSFVNAPNSRLSQKIVDISHLENLSHARENVVVLRPLNDAKDVEEVKVNLCARTFDPKIKMHLNFEKSVNSLF